MKKKLSLMLAVVSIFSIVSALPVFASPDPDVFVDAYIGYPGSPGSSVKAKSYATTSNTNMKKLNVHGTLYQGSSLIESGTGSTTSINTEASWLSSSHSSANSYTLQSASRTYYTDGTSSDQSYATYNWN